MASSPSAFLTFYRRMAASSSVRAAANSGVARPFSTSRPHFLGGERKTGDLGSNARHVLEKSDDKDPNVQAYESSKGQQNRQTGTGGHATEAKDSSKSKEKTKKDFPEAPVTIGMEDERGGKGA